MNTEPSGLPPDVTDEISSLIATLHQTGQRLEELTAGEVDTVADGEGRTFLLRQAQDDLRHNEAARQAAILNALPSPIALLNPQGDIVSVNEAWRRFARKKLPQSPGHEIGLNYLTLCADARPDEASDAQRIAEGVRMVLGGGERSFSIEYSCDSLAQKDWFLMTVTPLQQDRPGGAVVMQTDITERKRAEADRELAHQKLMEASHLAGMAEVATIVLHNVGNVLNSVNVSAGLVTENLRSSRVDSMLSVTALLREHASDLGSYLSLDPRGRHIPEFLEQIATDWIGQREAVIKELEALRANIDHIKAIVVTQQSQARASPGAERVSVAELVEDGLRMSEGALLEQRLRVVREFELVPPIRVEKHKVLQILVNLLRNARHACDQLAEARGQIILRVTQVGGRIRISVSDNGVGIRPENLTRIFSHGFTTRRDGHGFGLHSGALAAAELGGSLTVHSDGPDKGAMFTLELPLDPAP
jgi:signal transduction histidine kinase